MSRNKNKNINDHDKDIKAKFKSLIAIYQENSAKSKIPDRSDLAQLCFSTLPNQQNQLILTYQQYEIKHQLVKLILLNYKSSLVRLTTKLIDEIINEFSYQALENITDVEEISNKMLTRFREVKNQEFSIIKPAIIHILTARSVIKIIGLSLIPNPIPYFQNYYKDKPRILKALEHFNTMFMNKDPYNPTMPDVAAIAEIKAVDKVSAGDTFNRYSQEVAGFLKLFQPGCDVYFTTLKPKEIEQELVIKGDGISGSNGYTSKTKFNRAGINDEIYEKYLDGGLKWLNDDINSDKAKKMRDALYWFNFATDEINLTNKFIYLITVLECILKSNTQSDEVATTIAERVAFILGCDKVDKKNIFDEMKKVYSRRSKIIHNGETLLISEELMVFETYDKVKNVLLKLLNRFSNPEISFEKFIDNFLYEKFADKSIV